MRRAQNNIFYVTAGGANLALLDETGAISISHNWLKPNWRVSHGTATGTVNNDGTSVQGTSPNFVNEGAQDFRLLSTSAAINAGTTLLAEVLPAHNVNRQYVKHQQSEARPTNAALDIGAYEFGSAALQITTANLPNAVRGRAYNQILQASGGSENFVRTISVGRLPVGLFLNSATGKIFGKGEVRGTWNFTITVQDSQNLSVTATRNYTIQTKLHSGD